MQEMQELPTSRRLLSARQVQELLDVDASTIYRMAGDGRLPAVKVGRQWRFPAAAIESLLGTAHRDRPDGDAAPIHSLAQDVLDLAAESLDVMMVVTDMEGRPLTDVANPCPRFERHADDPSFIAECAEEWRELADDPYFRPEFRPGRHQFECARSFIRSGRQLIGMVLAGGVAPAGSAADDLYHLSYEQRRKVLEALPKVAALLSRLDGSGGATTQPLQRSIQ